MKDTIFDMPTITKEVDLGGKKYKVTKYTISDFAEARDLLKIQRREEIVEIKEYLDEGVERGNAIRDKLKPITDEELARFMDGPIGASRMIWAMMNRHNKEFMTLEQFCDSVNMDKVLEIVKVMQEEETVKKNGKRGRPIKVV